MSKEKQTYNPCDDCQYSYSRNNQESGMCKKCEFTYFKDRKQSEGEWIGSGVLQHCSVCGNVINFRQVSRWLYNFCPNCGAKMKGGAE